MTRMPASFIDETAIEAALAEGRKRVSRDNVEAIIKKAATADGLAAEEVAVLLHVEDKELLQEIFKTAIAVKRQIYGNRLVLFAPLYVSDYCINNCVYCGYGAGHKFARRRLTMEEIRKETEVLLGMGHKRLAMEAGEDPQNCPIDYILEAIEAVYSVEIKNANIRRININIAATTVGDYRLLKAAEIGTYILFQESYHRDTYARMHPIGPKHDYDYHTTSFDRAMEAGIDDVGAGVLFGFTITNSRCWRCCSMRSIWKAPSAAARTPFRCRASARPATLTSAASRIWCRTTSSRSWSPSSAWPCPIPA